jgi:tricarballylate dehydrogenase
VSQSVVVVGSGNAAMSAALSAVEAGARVTVLEKSGRDEAGGNSWYTAGAYRVVHGGVDDVRPLLDDPTDPRLDRTELAPYPAEAFAADMHRLTDGRSDPQMCAVLVEESIDGLRWLSGHGIPFELMYPRQAYEVDGLYRFWGGLALGVVGGGKALVALECATAEAAGVEVRYECPVTGIVRADDGRVVAVETPSGPVEADAFVLASGGFQADEELRAQHLGDRWRAAKVRGTRHNTGEVLMQALAIGAGRAGDWSTCHAVAWDADAPPTGDRELTNRLTKQGYPYGLVVNRDGRRFIDEGEDFRNYTYAKLGAAIVEQPGAAAFQLFDARTLPLLRVLEYDVPGIRRSQADDVVALAQAAGIDAEGLAATVREFNAAVGGADGFDPTLKDGKSTAGLQPEKSNWALPLDSPPFVAVAVTCGITFTFGGLRTDVDARVLDESGAPIEGLYAAGEIVGGLFAGNYPGGSGLTAGTVFGRRAGANAARAPKAATRQLAAETGGMG